MQPDDEEYPLEEPSTGDARRLWAYPSYGSSGALDHADTLLTFAEIAVAFAGFSSVVVVFRNRGSGTWAGLDAFRYRSMLSGSLLAAAYAGLPMVVSWLGFPRELVWRVSSAALLVWFAVLVFVQFRTRSLFPTLGGTVRWILFLSTSVGIAVWLSLNVIGVVPDGPAEPYLVGVTWILFLAGWQFFQLVSLPNDGPAGPAV